MRVDYSGPENQVTLAVQRSNELLLDDSFFERIRIHEKFDMSTAAPAQIARLLATANTTVSVKLYRSRWPWSKALAFEDARFPATVFLNERRLDRSIASICATIVHECVHAVDSADPALRFGHGDNSPNGKENTAPYWIGDLAYELVAGKPAQYAQLMVDMDSEWA